MLKFSIQLIGLLLLIFLSIDSNVALAVNKEPKPKARPLKKPANPSYADEPRPDSGQLEQNKKIPMKPPEPFSDEQTGSGGESPQDLGANYKDREKKTKRKEK